jgi:hypothetical protein
MNITRIFKLMLLLALVLPIAVSAQKRDDTPYLKGAVPEVGGKVVFSKDFVINGLNKDEVYNRMLNYLTTRMANNKDELSRVVYTDKDKGEIVALSNEWVIFSQGALSLDRTKMKFQITAECSDGKCNVSIFKISYTYRETEKYVAEEWITDKYALNKAQTKLVAGLAKWRRKTVDLMNAYFTEMRNALSAQPEVAVVKEKPEVSASTGTVVINAQPASKAVVAPVVAASKPQTVVSSLHAVKPGDVQGKMTSALYSCKVVVVAGVDEDNMTTMTANKGISIGFVAGKPTAFVYFNTNQATEAIISSASYTIKLIEQGSKKMKMMLKCNPISSKIENDSRVVAGEILSAEAE